MSTQTIRLVILSMVVTGLGLLSSCGLDDINLTNYGIEYPVKNETYIGITKPSLNDQGTKQLGDQPFKITFTTVNTSQPKISLNGHNVASHFTFHADHAVADASKLRNFLRQGVNTLSVNRSSFGPEVTFKYDGAGPVLIIEDALVENSTLKLKGFLRDFSDLQPTMELKLIQVTGYDNQNRVQRNERSNIAVAINSKGQFDQEVPLSNYLSEGKPLLYSFNACDKYGYCTAEEYLADTEGSTALPLENAVMVAIGDTLMQSMTPVIGSSVKTTLDAAPIDMRCLKEPGVGPGHPDEGKGLLTTTNLTSWEDGGKKTRKQDVLWSKYKCANWNDPLICGKKRGVISGKNITLAEYEEYKEKEGSSFLPIEDPYFTCDDSPNEERYYHGGPDYNKDGGKLGGISPFATEMAGTVYAGYMQHIYFYDGNPASIQGGDFGSRIVGALNGKPAGTVNINQLQVLPNNRLKINIVMTNMFVRLELTQGYNGMCEFWTKPYNVEFPGIALLLPKMTMDAEIELDKPNAGTELSLQMKNANVNFDNAPVFQDLNIKCGVLSLPLGGLVDGLSGMISGLISDMVPDIMNQVFEDNLKSLTFGGLFTGEEIATSFDAALAIQQIGTESHPLTSSFFDLKTALQSTFKVVDADKNAPRILGPAFIDDPINPSDIFNATSGGDANITVAVNSNLINAALATLHSTGLTYLTLYKGKTYYGANPNTPAEDQAAKDSPVLSSVKNGDVRTRLWPDMPPTLSFSKVQGKSGETRAQIEYKSATLYQDKFKDDKWENEITIKVHFDIAVEINDDENGNFTMGAAGPPTFVIDDFENNTFLQVPQLVLQKILDTAMRFGGDVLASQFFTFNFNQLVDENLNGQTVQYFSAQDNYRLPEGECVYITGFDKVTGQPSEFEIPEGGSAGTDGKPDLICYEFNFDVATHTAGSTGAKGSNLFFQMKLADNRLPPPPAVPRFDLDGDGTTDYRDNCAVPQAHFARALGEEHANIDIQTLIYKSDDPEVESGEKKAGDPVPGAVETVRNAVHAYYASAAEFGRNPNADDIAHYNSLRKGDAEVHSSNWVDILYSNRSQTSTFEEGKGDLCFADTDRDGIPDQFDNCPGVFNPDQEIDGVSKMDYEPGDIGDACNVKKTFVMLRSLGSKKDTGTYQCLTHEGYNTTANGGGTSGGVNYSRTMSNSNGRITKNCDPADINQHWYLVETAGAQAKINGLANNAKATELAGVYHLYADKNKDNSTSWQLVANVNGNGELRMAKMNSPTRLFRDDKVDDMVAGWVLDIDPSAITAQNEDEQLQPWVLRTWKLANLQTACLFYNNDGWGADINADQCADTYLNVGRGGKDNLWFRWGIYIGGTEQLWDASY